MTQSGIYRIELGNGSFYIGSAVNLVRRKSQHKTELNRKKHCNKRAQRCWNKYKIFEWSILEFCEVDDLIEREQHYLDLYFKHRKCVNICAIAGSSIGIKRSSKTRKKISESHKKRAPVSVETRKKLSDAGKGRKHSPETRKKISAASSSISDETRAKMSASLMGHKHSEETIAKLSGRKRSPESRAKMSDALRNRAPISDETRTKMSDSHTGRKHSAESRAKMSERTFSVEHRSRLSDANMRRAPITEETRNKMAAAQLERWARAREQNNNQPETQHD